MSAILDENCNDNFGIPVRRKSDEPGMIFGFATLRIKLLSHDLSRSRFAGDIETLYPRTRGSSAGFINHTPHRSTYDIHCGLLHRIFLGADFGRIETESLALCGTHQVRLLQPPTGGEPTHGPGCLHRGNTDGALTNGNRNCFAVIP